MEKYRWQVGLAGERGEKKKGRRRRVCWSNITTKSKKVEKSIRYVQYLSFGALDGRMYITPQVE